MKRPEGFDTPPASAKKDAREHSSEDRSARSLNFLRFRRGKVLEGSTQRDSGDGEKKRRELTPKQEQKRLERRLKKVERAEMRKFTRTLRQRRIIFWSCISVVCVFIAALAIAVFSPLFAVRNIHIVGTDRLDAESIEAALDHHVGVPLPLLDRSQIADDLEHFPGIESYLIESVLPDTLKISLVERTPILVYQVGKEFRLVDAAGIVLAESDEADPAYPRLILDEGTEFVDGFFPSVNVLRALPENLLEQVDTISASTNDNVSLTLKDNKRQVLWGDSSQPQLKSKLVEQLFESVPNGKVYDVSSPETPSVK